MPLFLCFRRTLYRKSKIKTHILCSAFFFRKSCRLWEKYGRARQVKLKVKCTLVLALRVRTGWSAHRGSRVIALLFLDYGTRWLRGQRHLPAALLFQGKTRYPLYRRLGRPHGRSGQVRKISPPPAFDPWTVQPVAIRYTVYATRPTRASQATDNIIRRMLDN